MPDLDNASIRETHNPCCGKSYSMDAFVGLESGCRRIHPFCRTPVHISDGEYTKGLRNVWRLESWDHLDDKETRGTFKPLSKNEHDIFHEF